MTTTLIAFLVEHRCYGPDSLHLRCWWWHPVFKGNHKHLEQCKLCVASVINRKGCLTSAVTVSSKCLHVSLRYAITSVTMGFSILTRSFSFGKKTKEIQKQYLYFLFHCFFFSWYSMIFDVPLILFELIWRHHFPNFRAWLVHSCLVTNQYVEAPCRLKTAKAPMVKNKNWKQIQLRWQARSHWMRILTCDITVSTTCKWIH